MAGHNNKTDKTQIDARINAAARRLSRFSLDGKREGKFADRYIRHSTALDPDTPLAGKPRLH